MICMQRMYEYILVRLYVKQGNIWEKMKEHNKSRAGKPNRKFPDLEERKRTIIETTSTLRKWLSNEIKSTSVAK